MLSLALILSASLLAYVIFTQPIELRIFKSSGTVLQISTVIWSYKTNLSSKNKNKSKLKLTKRLRLYLFLLRVAKDLLTKSYIYVVRDTVTISEFPSAPSTIAANIASSLLISYVSGKARFFESGVDKIGTAVFSFRLIDLFISALKVSYYTLKSKLKKRTGYV